jgi:hypothetical protein
MTTVIAGWNSQPQPFTSFHPALVEEVSFTAWWFYPSSKILVNGKDYPIYYGK